MDLLEGPHHIMRTQNILFCFVVSVLKRHDKTNASLYRENTRENNGPHKLYPECTD